jgi:hypothetical protein
MALDTDLTSVKQDLVTRGAVDVGDFEGVVKFGAWRRHLAAMLLEITTTSAGMVVGMRSG